MNAAERAQLYLQHPDPCPDIVGVLPYLRRSARCASCCARSKLSNPLNAIAKRGGILYTACGYTTGNTATRGGAHAERHRIRG